MKAVILAVALTLVGCQQQQINETYLNPKKVLSYNYEFQNLNRIPGKGFSSNGIKVKCKVDFGRIDPEWKFVRAHSFEAMDYNGEYPLTQFVPSPKLTEVFEKQCKDVIVKYQHKNGHVGELMAPNGTSQFVLNIFKGILNMQEYTIKPDQRTYNLRENGVEGKCNTTYILQNTEKPDEFLVTKSKDLTDCDNMTLKVVGATHVVPCRLCKQQNRNFQATAIFSSRIKNLKDENKRLILQANVQEIRQFIPFNEQNGGNAIMDSRQKMEFFEAHDNLPEIPSDLKKHGSLSYHFENDWLPLLPVPLFKAKSIEKEIEDGLHYLANEKFPSNGTIRFLYLVQLLRTENYVNYSSVFNPYFSQPAHRRIILDLIPAVGNSAALRYIQDKMVREEITSVEIAQTLLVFFHFCNASEEVLEEAMAIVTEVLKGPQSLHRSVLCLSYGTLLFRFYTVSDTISDKYLKPLTDFATQAIRSSDIDAIDLVLKTYGNVGHQNVLKPILKFLQTTTSSDVRIQNSALMALRNLGRKDPIKVQGILLQVIMNHRIDPTARVLAIFVLFESKPTFPVLMILANSMLHEPSVQVENFLYTSLSAMARSTAPESQLMASSCRMALKVLSEKIQHPAGYRFSRFCYIDFFRESLMAGMESKIAFIHSKGSMYPKYIIAKLTANIMGSIISPLEVGITSDGISQIIERLYEGSNGEDWKRDSQQPQKRPFDQKITAHEQIALGGHLKIFDQEILTGNLKMNIITKLYEAYHGKLTLPWIKDWVDIIKTLPNIQWEKNLMSAEIQHVVPTCTGLPWQIGLVHVAHTKITGSVQLQMTPEPTSQITWPEVVNSETKLKTRLTVSVNKDMILTMGIVTPDIHVILEEKATLTTAIPLNADLTVNIKENHFKLEFPPCKQEMDIISLRFKTSAIIRNIEEAPAAKSIPVYLPERASKRMMQPLDIPSVERDETKDSLSSEKKSSEYVDSQMKQHLESVHQTMCFETCTFGCKVCVAWANAYAGCILGDSVYNIVGEHTFKLSLRRDDTKDPIEKLRFTIWGGAHAAEQMVPLLRNEEKELVINRKIITDDASKNIDILSSSQERFSKKKIESFEEEEEEEKEEEEEDQEQQNQDQKNQPDQQHSQGKKQQPDYSSRRSSKNIKHFKDKKYGKTYSSNQKSLATEKQARRPSAHYDEEEPIRFNWGVSFPTRVQGLQWSVLSFKESQIKQDQSSGSSHHSKVNESSLQPEQQEAKTPRDILLPYASIVAEAVRSDNKKQGYTFSLYGKEKQYKIHFKIDTSKLDQSKWRLCFDSLILPFTFQNSLSWGNECNDYKAEVKISRGQIASYEASQMDIKWTKLPLSLEKTASWSMDFLPGTAYALGFSTAYQKNPMHEMMFRIITTSPETSVVIFKIPGKTFYKDDLCVPFPLPGIPTPYYQTPELSAFNLASWLAKGDQAVCEVDNQSIKTFDSKVFSSNFTRRNCDLLVAQDCTTSASHQPQFHVWIRIQNPDDPRVVHIYAKPVQIIIQPSLDTLTVLRNKEPILTNSERYEDNAASIVISRKENIVTVSAPKHGLQSVTYDGITLRITAASKMKGHTCGLCGDNNGEIRNELRMPNQELALKDADFFHSWILVDS